MREQEILAKVDHTLLRQTATWEEIQELCREAIQFGTASVCIPPCYVRQAAEYLQELLAKELLTAPSPTEKRSVFLRESIQKLGALQPAGRFPVVCTVIGFPNGNMTTGAKCYEAKEALEAGAEEIDMVINLGWVKAGDYAAVEEEIRQIKTVCGTHILKVIIETCLLTEEEKIALCQVVSHSGADFIKTSTGFAAAGATPEDVALFAAHVEPHVKIKAAGGIASFADAERFIELGAERLGTSRLVSIVKARGQVIDG